MVGLRTFHHLDVDFPGTAFPPCVCVSEESIWQSFENGNNYKLMMDMEKKKEEEAPLSEIIKGRRPEVAGKLQTKKHSNENI